MTANELADKLENNTVSWGDCTHEQHDNDKYIKEQASAMLRQQAKEIQALKQRLELAEWDEETWKKFKKDNYEVIELGPVICNKCNDTGWVCGWLEETDEQVIANAEKRFPFLKKASEK
jgi:tRNA G10  N-methylase Trm11